MLHAYIQFAQHANYEHQFIYIIMSIRISSHYPFYFSANFNFTISSQTQDVPIMLSANLNRISTLN